MATALSLEGAESPLLIDDDDRPLFDDVTPYLAGNGYAYVHPTGQSAMPVHTLIMGRHPGMHVDHVNRVKLDCRRENLRVVTVAENGHNRSGANVDNKLGVLGVDYIERPQHRPKYRAQIRHEGVTYNLGQYDTLEQAAAARRAAEERFGWI